MFMAVLLYNRPFIRVGAGANLREVDGLRKFNEYYDKTLMVPPHALMGYVTSGIACRYRIMAGTTKLVNKGSAVSKRMIINMLAGMVILLGGVSYSVAGGSVSPQMIHISSCSSGGTDCYCDGVCHVGAGGATCYCADY